MDGWNRKAFLSVTSENRIAVKVSGWRGGPAQWCCTTGHASIREAALHAAVFLADDLEDEWTWAVNQPGTLASILCGAESG